MTLTVFDLAERIDQLSERVHELRAIDSVGNLGSGAVLFGATNGSVETDSTNFVWDNTNKRVGVNTNTPATALEVIGAGRFSSHVEAGTGNTGAGDNTYIRLSLSAATGGEGRLDAFRSGVGGTNVLFGTVFAGNWGFWGNSFGSGSKVIFIGNRTTAPTVNPTAGGVLYAEAGALKWRGSGGTTTTIAPA